jgi:hypothetical protein
MSQEEVRMATTPKSERPSAKSAGVQRVRTKLTGAGTAARRTMERLRGGQRTAVSEKSAPENTTTVDEAEGDPTAPPDNPAAALWRMVTRARIALVIVVAVIQVVLALVSWRVKVWRARRRGHPEGQEALEDVGAKLGDLAAKFDASGEE